MSKFGDWKKLEDIMKGFDKRLEKNCNVALARAGLVLETAIKRRLLTSADMKALHSFSIRMKGSSKPLIDHGDLIASVHSVFVEADAVFVGVNRKNAAGVDIAALHEREKGTRIKVTPKMRAWLAVHGLRLKKSTTELFIPGRPYVKPAYRDFKQKGVAKELFIGAVKKTLGGE